MSAATLVGATDLRIDVGGVPAIEHATFASSGRSMVLTGENSALIGAVLGQARIAGGALTLVGCDVNQAEHWQRPGMVGVAPLDPPVPGDMTARAYLVAGAQLAGLRRHDAEEACVRTLAALELTPLERRLLSTLGRAELRAIVLAQAVVSEPLVLLAQAPVSDLSGPEAAYVARVFAAASKDRRWICSVPAITPGSPEYALATSADDLLVFSSGHLVHQTTLAVLQTGSTGYTVTLRGDIAAFAQALTARGVTFSGGPPRFWIELSSHLSPVDLLAISLETNAPIVELYPRLLGPGQW